MQLFDIQQDFFLPVWRRVAVIIICLGWAIVEFLADAPFWGMIFGGLGIFVTWQLFFDGWPASTAEGGSDSNTD